MVEGISHWSMQSFITNSPHRPYDTQPYSCKSGCPVYVKNPSYTVKRYLLREPQNNIGVASNSGYFNSNKKHSKSIRLSGSMSLSGENKKEKEPVKINRSKKASFPSVENQSKNSAGHTIVIDSSLLPNEDQVYQNERDMFDDTGAYYSDDSLFDADELEEEDEDEDEDDYDYNVKERATRNTRPSRRSKRKTPIVEDFDIDSNEDYSGKFTYFHALL